MDSFKMLEYPNMEWNLDFTNTFPNGSFNSTGTSLFNSSETQSTMTPADVIAGDVTNTTFNFLMNVLGSVVSDVSQTIVDKLSTASEESENANGSVIPFVNIQENNASLESWNLNRTVLTSSKITNGTAPETLRDITENITSEMMQEFATAKETATSLTDGLFDWLTTEPSKLLFEADETTTARGSSHFTVVTETLKTNPTTQENEVAATNFEEASASALTNVTESLSTISPSGSSSFLSRSWQTNTTVQDSSTLQDFTETTTTSKETRRQTNKGLQATLRLVERVCEPIIFSLGTVGNVLTVVILCLMKSWDNPLYVFLAALAISDELVLVNGLLFLWLGRVTGLFLWNTHGAACKMIFWTVETAAKLSSWILVALTFQRTVAVTWPHLVHVIFTRTRCLLLIGSLALSFMLMHAEYLQALHLIQVRNRTYCYYNSADMAYMKYLDLLFFTLLPFACLLLGNGVLAWQLVVSVKAKTLTFGSGHDSQVHTRQKQASGTSLTVMVVSLAFFVFTLPICVRNLLNLMGEGAGEKGGAFTTVASLLGYCNNAVNFYLYCLTGTKFRHHLKALFCCCRK